MKLAATLNFNLVSSLYLKSATKKSKNARWRVYFMGFIKKETDTIQCVSLSNVKNTGVT